MHGLRIQVRRQALGFRAFATKRQHVRREVTTVDVQARPEVRDEEPSGPARDVESRLTVVLDELLEVRDLGAVHVELGPPSRNDPVVPGLRLLFPAGHLPTSVLDARTDS